MKQKTLTEKRFFEWHEDDVSVTLRNMPNTSGIHGSWWGGYIPMIVIGVDLYNQCTTGGVSKTLNSIATDADHVPCVVIYEDENSE